MAEAPVRELATGWTPRRRLAALFGAVVIVLAGLAWVEHRDESNRPAGTWTMAPYEGLGTWVDAYDWTDGLSGGSPSIDAEDMEAVAAEGVQTVFLQTPHARLGPGIPEQERLEELIDAAHDNGMHVVAWYLPTFEDVDADLDQLVASMDLDVDGLAVDLEATNVADIAERTTRLVDLSRGLRSAVDRIDLDRPIGAITLSAVHLEVVNPAFWPGYPWADIGANYDVVLPMAYWTLRTGDLRDAGRYTAENLDLVRSTTGLPDLPVHLVGGIADEATDDDLATMVRIVENRGAIGASLYDWATSTPSQWAVLAPLRRAPAS